MNQNTQPIGAPSQNPDHLRDCRIAIVNSVARRTSNRVPWYKPIGPDAALSATAGLLDCGEQVPKDLLRALELPLKSSWATLARILRSSISIDGHGEKGSS